MHPTHVARRAARNLADSKRENDIAYMVRHRRQTKRIVRKLEGPKPPLPDGVANRRLYVDGFHPPVVDKREPTAFVKAQWKQKSDFEFRGRPAAGRRAGSPKGRSKAKKLAKKRAARW